MSSLFCEFSMIKVADANVVVCIFGPSASTEVQDIIVQF